MSSLENQPDQKVMPVQEAGSTTGSRYWRSLDDLADTPAFREWAEREFPQGASEIDGVNRRHFMKIMAASFGLAGFGLAGCRQPKHLILPYARQPENIIPGSPQFYSSSRPTPWENVPVIVETHSARPTKIEGNPSYTATGGATDVFTQASVLDLYDPARARFSRRGRTRLRESEVRDLLADYANRLGETRGKGFAVLAEPSASPTRRRLVAGLRRKYPEMVWAEYEAIDVRAGERAAAKYYAGPVRTYLRLEKARRVLTLDADFLGKDPNAIAYTRAFSQARRVDAPEDGEKMVRLYSAEADFSLTGAMADHRLRVSPREFGRFLVTFAEALIEAGAPAGPLRTITAVAGDRFTDGDHELGWIKACADDLWAARGQSLLAVGPSAPEDVQMMALIINEVLGAPGNTLDLLQLPEETAATPVHELAEAMDAGHVKTLFIIGGNPSFDLPGDLSWSVLQAKVAEVVRYGYWDDETSLTAGVHLAAAHYLESWGDGETFDGTLVPVQPMIEPLVPCFSEIELLARLGGLEQTDPYVQVKETFAQRSGAAGVDAAFNHFLAVGVLPESGYSTLRGGISPRAANALSAVTLPGAAGFDDLDVQFKASFHVADGRFANNGWMMECPDPMTKLTWDNAFLIGPKLAKQLEESDGVDIFPGLTVMNRTGQLVRNTARFRRGAQVAPVAQLVVNGVELTGPVTVVPGLADYTVIIPLGFGREVVGPVGRGTGFNAFPAVSSSQGLRASGARLRLTAEDYRMANVQEHWSMEGREILREGSVEEFAENPGFVSKMGMESHSPPIFGKDKHMPLHEKVRKIPRGGSAYETPEFTDPHQWGMSIDLNVCTGCNACVVACQSENNIPIVGKDQVMRGREMHWIRLDRYFSAATYAAEEVPEDVQVSFQGMACVHCELAPCETVCPVNATVHDEQGLNVMAYNRCVGTRYCANNCPYKVRRFNFFDWNKREVGKFYLGPLGPDGPEETIKMQKNPDVSVRMRGVMEKCTYCVQRIQQGRMNQKVKAGASDNIMIPDGTVKTACQQVCPAGAIVFGNVADPESEVNRAKNSPRDYAVLGYLNVRPRTTYLAKLRNPNPEIPAAYRYDLPFGRQDYENRFGSGAHDSANGHGAEQPAEETTL